jgi:hypothetical protein
MLPARSPLKLSGIAIKLLGVYKTWHSVTPHIPKMLRYSLGVRIDALFAEIVELTASAQFSPERDRSAIIGRTIAKNDLLKFMLYALFELKGIEEVQFTRLAPDIEEIGRMLYGWKRRTEKENDTPMGGASSSRERKYNNKNKGE